jgi:hypothetical protein
MGIPFLFADRFSGAVVHLTTCGAPKSCVSGSRLLLISCPAALPPGAAQDCTLLQPLPSADAEQFVLMHKRLPGLYN